MNINDDAGTPN